LSHRPGCFVLLKTKGQMKTTWSPTLESFEKLMEWLDSNREEAVAKYERIRVRLIRYFVCNGCGDADEHLADEAFNRVMKKLERGEIPAPFTGDKVLYFLAFARNIRREHVNNRIRPDIPEPMWNTEAVENESFCLDECVRILGEEDRWLAIEYYRFDKTTKVAHHKALAGQFGVGLPGLRTRIHRVRERLRPCIEECLERFEQ
jgi:DNA-directed RNA polymerase specialized sigma24 family protein